MSHGPNCIGFVCTCPKERELIECPSDCSGCYCHINPPCHHCTDGHGMEVEDV